LRLSITIRFSVEYPQQLSYWGKQLLAREVDLERMRRAQPKTTGGKPVASSSKEQQSKPTATAVVDKNVPNFLQKLQPKKVSSKTTKETVSAKILKTDFFFSKEKGSISMAALRIKIC
jgi:hypothetical protein